LPFQSLDDAAPVRKCVASGVLKTFVDGRLVQFETRDRDPNHHIIEATMFLVADGNCNKE
jgi:hypothetical protein